MGSFFDAFSLSFAVFFASLIIISTFFKILKNTSKMLLISCVFRVIYICAKDKEIHLQGGKTR